MRGPAGAGDDHLEPRRPRPLGEGDQAVGRAMRRDDARLVFDSEFIERVGGVPHVAQSDWLPMMIATGAAARVKRNASWQNLPAR